MSLDHASVVTTYTSGSWVGLAAPQWWLLLEASPSHEVVQTCRDLLLAGSDMDRLHNALGAAGQGVGGFAALTFDADDGRLLIRGDAIVHVTAVDGREAVLTAPADGNVSGHSVDDTAAIFDLRSPAEPGPVALPLRGGVVLAARLRVELRDVRRPAPLAPDPPPPPESRDMVDNAGVEIIEPTAMVEPTQLVAVLSDERLDPMSRAVLHFSTGVDESLDQNLVIGRDPQVRPDDDAGRFRLVVVPEEAARVSRTHCEIRREGSQAVIVDRGSTNGTFIDSAGASVRLAAGRPHVLTSGARIRLGDELTIQYDTGDVGAEPAVVATPEPVAVMTPEPVAVVTPEPVAVVTPEPVVAAVPASAIAAAPIVGSAEPVAAARFCRTCGTALRPNAKFCGGCGAPARPTPPVVVAPGPASCASCGRSLRAGAAFCVSCGAPASG